MAPDEYTLLKWAVGIFAGIVLGMVGAFKVLWRAYQKCQTGRLDDAQAHVAVLEELAKAINNGHKEKRQ